MIICGILAAVSMQAAAGMEDAYFAPDGPTLFKVVLPDGNSYRFEFDFSKPGRLVSSVGWTGEYERSGRVMLKSPSGDFLEFDRGRLVRFRFAGKEGSFAYDTPRKAPANAVTPLAMLIYDEKELSKKYIAKEEAVKWAETGRLAFPYVNPNFSGALYAEIALLLLAFAWSRRRNAPVCVVTAVVSAIAVACAVWSGSRGALLGLFAGIGIGMLFVVLRTGLTIRMAASVLAVFAAIVAIAFAVGQDNLMRGFGGDGGMTWSNALRVEMMKAAPRMMADAPGGWLSFGVGKGFTYWYQPLGMVLMSGSLINAHLTWLVGFGAVGRLVYLFTLFAVVWLSFRTAVRESNMVPLTVLTGFAVIACFNPIFAEWGLWVVPALSSIPLLASLRRIGRKPMAVGLLAAAVSSAVVVYALVLVGSCCDGMPSIAYDGAAVRVGGSRPKTWVVDDGQGVLGGVLVGRDIREHYLNVRHAPAIGYVRSVEDLPASGVERLVLPGKSANDWLLMLSENEKARDRLPKTVVFLNPPFSPSEVPQGVLALCRPKLLVGEFAARYNPEYQTPPSWVSIVPGAEKYLPGWMFFALGE